MKEDPRTLLQMRRVHCQSVHSQQRQATIATLSAKLRERSPATLFRVRKIPAGGGTRTVVALPIDSSS